MEDAIRSKVIVKASVLPSQAHVFQITARLDPSTLEIKNNSHLHSHHRAMAGSTSRETHFEVLITSEEFKVLSQVKRHQMVYKLLADELAAQGGIHALELTTWTPEQEKAKRGH